MVPEKILCDCGHMESDHESYTRGYATDRDGKTLCLPCAHERNLADMHRDGIVFGYVNRGFTEITSWPGGSLLHITDHWEINKPFGWGKHDGFMSSDYYAVTAVDDHGKVWHGSGHGEGIYITMRRNKAR